MPREFDPAAHTLATLLEAQVAAGPDRTAVAYPHASVTFRELRDRAGALARSLLAHDVGAGRRIGLFLPNCLEYIDALFAAALVGAQVVPINARFKRRELAHVVARSEIAILLTTSEAADHVDFPGLVLDSLPGLAEAEPGRPVALETAPHLRHVVVLGAARPPLTPYESVPGGRRRRPARGGGGGDAARPLRRRRDRALHVGHGGGPEGLQALAPRADQRVVGLRGGGRPRRRHAPLVAVPHVPRRRHRPPDRGDDRRRHVRLGSPLRRRRGPGAAARRGRRPPLPGLPGVHARGAARPGVPAGALRVGPHGAERRPARHGGADPVDAPADGGAPERLRDDGGGRDGDVHARHRLARRPPPDERRPVPRARDQDHRARTASPSCPSARRARSSSAARTR